NVDSVDSVDGVDDMESAGDLSRRKSYRGILLTGATGFFGIYLLEEILKTTTAHIYVLVRGTGIEEAEKRMALKASYYWQNGFYERHRQRFTVICGDLCRERLGIEEQLYRRLTDDIDCIVNSAAYVKHFGSYEEFHLRNVESVQRLLEFAATGCKKDVNHISTISVGGGENKNSTFSLFTEFNDAMERRHGDVYNRSKWEAERVILQAREEGVSANIFRVGNLVFHSKTGVFQENIGENAFYVMLRSLIKLGVMLEMGPGMLDFSFIDCAAAAVVRLFDKELLLNRTYHIHNPVDTGLTQLGHMLQREEIPLDIVEFPVFLDRLADAYREAEQRPHVEHLLLHSGLFEKGGGSPVEISSLCTDGLLEKLGFKWPPLNEKHIKKMIEHCRKVSFL
ncbi:MAG: NAD-dependent epimerase/dehydratase family protein, partial [bacterium]|nr:NAD-dependent epimerase/dehydratase family protein [bacterium]